MRTYGAPIIILSVMLSACAEQGSGPVISSGDRYAAADSISSEYALGAGDRIRLSVFGEPSLSGEYTVGPTGSLSLPLIGDVVAKGRVLREVTEEALRRLADGYLRTPRLSAEIVTYRPFFVLGEVESSGQYPYSAGMTVFNAIALARGFTPRANRDVVRIRRQGEAGEVNYLLTPELRVYPGDTLRIGERFF